MRWDWRETERLEDWVWGKWMYREEKQESKTEAVWWKREGRGESLYKKKEWESDLCSGTVEVQAEE